MALHFKTTDEAGRWCVVRAAGSLVIAGFVVWAGMMGMDSLEPRPVAVYRPQFVGWGPLDTGTGCGGARGCGGGKYVQRKPTPPVMRPLGLAGEVGGNGAFAHVAFPDAGLAEVDFPEADFGDGDDFSGGWDGSGSWGSFDQGGID